LGDERGGVRGVLLIDAAEPGAQDGGHPQAAGGHRKAAGWFSSPQS
jgi:hypothetical protein